MKGKKWKEKKKGKKASGMEDDMKEVLADPRFSHVASDLRLRHMPKDEHKVKLDSRFSSVLTVSLLSIVKFNSIFCCYNFYDFLLL